MTIEETLLDAARATVVAMEARVAQVAQQLACGERTSLERAVLLELAQPLPAQVEQVEYHYALAELSDWTEQALASDARVAAIDMQSALIEQRMLTLAGDLGRLKREEADARQSYRIGGDEIIAAILKRQILPRTELGVLDKQLLNLYIEHRRAAGPGVMLRLRCQSKYEVRLIAGDFVVNGPGREPSDKWDRPHSVAALAYATAEAQRTYSRLFVNHSEVQR